MTLCPRVEIRREARASFCSQFGDGDIYADFALRQVKGAMA